MISRIYVDNFRCLTNFTLNLDSLNLLLGANGSGKSSVLEVLRRLQRLLNDQELVDAVFPSEDLTRWQTQTIQNFEVDLSVADGVYRYSLKIEHSLQERKRRIKEERLTWNNQPLFLFDGTKAHLYRDNHSAGPEFLCDWSRSSIAFLQERNDNKRLTQFRQAIGHWVLVKILPASIDSTSLIEESRLNTDASNFASWYRFLSQVHQGNILELTQTLREILPGFDQFSLREHGEEVRVLKVFMRSGSQNEKALPYAFNELSDGQRMLVVLYTLLIGLKGEGYSLFLDEPDNFISLREIQPWLLALQNACGEGVNQVALISHHPEVLNLFAHDNGLWFSRSENGHVQVKNEPPADVENLSPAEVVARGWDV
jgi:predicted ATPase